MYKKVNITENHMRVMSLFTRGFDREYHIREAQKLLMISPRTAQLILNDLEKKAVLESKMRGKAKVYRIKGGCASRDYLMLTEQYKRIAFLASDMMAREVLEKAAPSIKGIALVFGSYAKGKAKEGSDLDIFVIGSCKRDETRKVSDLYGMEINVKTYPMKVFKREMGTDILIREVLADHIVISGLEELISMVVK